MNTSKLNPWNWFTKEEGNGSPSLVKSSSSPERQDTGWNPWSLHREIDRLFNDTFGSLDIFPSLSRRNLDKSLADGIIKPKVDITGTDKEYSITAELPGIEEKNIEVELKGDILSIKARQEQEKKDEGKGYYRIERHSGSFQRILHLPDDADEAGIKASYENGVLTVTVPRIQGLTNDTKRIELQK